MSKHELGVLYIKHKVGQNVFGTWNIENVEEGAKRVSETLQLLDF